MPKLKLVQGKHYYRDMAEDPEGRVKRRPLKKMVPGDTIVVTAYEAEQMKNDPRWVDVTGQPEIKRRPKIPTKQEETPKIPRRAKKTKPEKQKPVVDAPEREPTQEEEPEEKDKEVFSISHRGGGRWAVVNGEGKKVNDRYLTKEEAIQLAEKLN